MAQTEDTELRDLVIEALDKNGSLAKIRALLRANIFLAFEDDSENLKQNVNLDDILKLPEGTLALSIVHEFLEFCSLKNTLFVYMSESRQGTEYNYDGKNVLAEKLHVPKCDSLKEPLLVTLIKNILKSSHRRHCNQNDSDNYRKHEKHSNNYRDEQNCTYIIHDSQSSSTSTSQSDNSSDEKNKLHLRLQLDNSDTDTSSDSARDKNSSEYIPGDHILAPDSKIRAATQAVSKSSDLRDLTMLVSPKNEGITSVLNDLKMATNSSSDSTSYIELKPFKSVDEKMLNTSGLPITEKDEKDSCGSITYELNLQNGDQSKIDSAKSVCLNSISVSGKTENEKIESDKRSQVSGKSDAETADYSFDFTSSPKPKDTNQKHTESTEPNLEKNKSTSIDSPHQVSQSSQSSVSLSDVADLISEKSFLSHHTSNENLTTSKSRFSGSNHSKEKDRIQKKINSDDSGDFTESPVPSLSNLSLDIHSD